ncbi:C2 domain-containing protein, partial [Operophtera brumata]
MISESGGSSSQPDLSRLHHTELVPSSISLRKRKTPDNDFAYQFSEFKEVILRILIASSRCNSENINAISEYISSIKDQLSDIKATTEHLIIENQGIGVELVRALDCHPPSVSNVFCECDSKDDVLVRALDCHPPSVSNVFCKCDSKDDVVPRPSEHHVHHRQADGGIKFNLSPYPTCPRLRRYVESAAPRLPLHYDSMPPCGNLQFNLSPYLTCPRLRRYVESAAPRLPLHYDSMPPSGNLQFNLSPYPTCPRLRRYVESAAPRLPLHYDSMVKRYPPCGNLQFNLSPYPTCPRLRRYVTALLRNQSVDYTKRSKGLYRKVDSICSNEFRFKVKCFQLQHGRQHYTSTPNSTAGSGQLMGDKRLLVKRSIAGKSGCMAPYCVVEMDEPPQKNQTAFKKDTVSPNWEEHFLLFLGLGLVGIDELLAAPSQRQQIALQTRPMEEHDVSGTLTVEFLAKMSLKSVCCVAILTKPPKKDSGKFIEVEREAIDKTIENGNGIVKDGNGDVKDGNGDIKEDTDQSTIDNDESLQSEIAKSVSASPTQSPGKTVRIKENGAKMNGDSGEAQGDYVSKLNNSEAENHRIRSISAERNNHASPAQSGDESRTSRSEMSGFSTASARTFIHEASTLVLETIEAGIKKHYLVPLTIAQRSKWRRKGVKLHIYNEH